MPSQLRIEVAGPDRKARRLFFADDLSGDGWERMTSAAVVRLLALKDGTLEKSTLELESTLMIAEKELAKERAFALLAYRARSRFELHKRLVDDGYPHELATAVVERIAELGYLDEREFAESLTRTKIAAGWGMRKIRRALLDKGVDEALVDEVCAHYLGAEDEIERALELISGKPCATRKECDRLVRRLVSKGFSLSVAYTALRAVQSVEGDVPDDLL